MRSRRVLFSECVGSKNFERETFKKTQKARETREVMTEGIDMEAKELETMEAGERVAALIAAGWTRDEASAIVGAEEAGELGIEAWRYEDQKELAAKLVAEDGGYADDADLF